MIKSVELVNFQGHKYSTFQFTPGVNVIKGPSHSGKTSVVRALRWVLQNKPQGDSFRRYFTDKDTRVTIEFTDGSYIIRERGKENRYVTSSGNYEAMRGSLPEEIAQISQMSEINIQLQHDPYFLIQDTAGTVAKKLNKVVGLEIIDEKLGKINRIINQTGAASNNAEVKVNEIIEELKAYKNLDKIEEDIKKVDSLMKKSWEFKKKSEYLEQTQRTVKLNYDKIIGLLALIELEKEAIEILDLIKESKAASFKYNQLGYIKRSIGSERSNCEHWTDFLTIEEDYNKLIGLSKQYREFNTKDVQLRNVQHSIQTQRSLIVDCGNLISAKDKEYNKTLKAQNICPLCKRPFNEGCEHENITDK